jgi:polyhydroxybutyrate depolymerase
LRLLGTVLPDNPMRVATLILLLAGIARVCAVAPAPTKWNVDGVEREALVFLPSKTDPKPPVIFAFHGHGGNMHFAARGMAFQDRWPEAIVVYPQGLPTPSLISGDEKGSRAGWQHFPGELGDPDVKFFDAVLATLREEHHVDENRIYATGFSNGGFFSYLLWAERGNALAALAPGGAYIVPAVKPTVPRPVLHYGGEQDRLVKFSEQQKAIDTARKIDNCKGAGQECGVNCTLYPSSTGTPVETVIHRFGHIYPPPVTGVIVKFFQDHPRSSINS